MEVGGAAKELSGLIVDVCHGIIYAFFEHSILDQLGSGFVNELTFRGADGLNEGKVVVCISCHAYKEETLDVVSAL